MGRSDEPGYFHICTDGNAVPWIFQDDEDFIAGVNRIGICSITSQVETVAYTDGQPRTLHYVWNTVGMQAIHQHI